jgi:hypothetical protein
LRSGLLVATLALALGGLLGFGVAGSLTPSGSATSFVGFGFLPAQGWHVSQAGALDASGVARAVAANVPLDPTDALRSVPRTTIKRLPVGGVVITATFMPRGDAEVDATYPVRQPPLRLDDAEPAGDGSYELRAGIRGYNVLLVVHFRADAPPTELVASAQRQLDRLVVAAERVTIFARPAIADGRPGFGSVRLFGSVDGARAGDTVAIEAKDCGSSFFRLVSGTTIEAGGSWSTIYWPGINTTVRAVWNDVSSPQVSIRARVTVSLQKKRDGKTLRVGVGAKRSFWRKRVEIQRRDRRLGTWKRVRMVTVTETYGGSGSGPAVGRSYTYEDFRLAVPRGTILRAVMPRSQVKPCYLAGTSNTLRT